MPNIKAVQIKPVQDGELSKSQMQFNRLSKEVDKLNKRLVKEYEILEQTLKVFHEEMVPLFKEDIYLKAEALIRLDAALAKYKFTKKERENCIYVIEAFIEDIISWNEKPQPEIQTIIDKYSEDSYDEIKDAEEEQSREFVIQIAKEMLGIDVDPESLNGVEINSLDDVVTFLNENYLNGADGESEEEEPDLGAEEDNKTAKPISEKQLQKKKREAEKEALKKKNIRSLYLSLAKILHPDTALNEAEKEEKEALMKEVTHAYDNNDFAMLIALESKWIHKTNENLSQINENVLSLYCEVLKDQVKELKYEIHMQKMDGRYMAIHDFEPFFRPSKAAVKRFREEVEDKKEQVEAQRDEILNLKKKDDFKKFARKLSTLFQMQEMLSFNKAVNLF